MSKLFDLFLMAIFSCVMTAIGLLITVFFIVLGVGGALFLLKLLIELVNVTR
jgi:hypothetical protein